MSKVAFSKMGSEQLSFLKAVKQDKAVVDSEDATFRPFPASVETVGNNMLAEA